MALVLRSNAVVVADPDTQVTPAAVRVDGGHVVAIGSLDDPTVAQTGDDVLDEGDRWLSPAFVNGHTHLAMSAFRGVTDSVARQGNVVTDLFFRLEATLTAADVRAFTRLGAYECLLSGIGSVWDHYYFGEAVAEGMRDVGLAGVVAPTLQDVSGPGATSFESELDATLRLAARTDLAEAGITAAYGPHATDTVSRELFERIATLARTHGLPVHLHAAQSSDEVEITAAREGRSPFDLIDQTGLTNVPQLLVAHAIFATRGDLEKLRQVGASIAICPYSQLQFATLAPVEAMFDVDLDWVVGSDCVASNDSHSLQKELALLAGGGALAAHFAPEMATMLERGGPVPARAAESRRLATVGAWPLLEPSALLAGVAGAGRRHFGLRVGDPAHLVVYDGNHPALWPGDAPLRSLTHADCARAIHAMYVAGRPVGEAGHFAESLIQSREYREALTEASRRRDELFARI